jgi:hypothetical protein
MPILWHTHCEDAGGIMKEGDQIDISLGSEHDLRGQRIVKMIVEGNELYYETDTGERMTCRDFTLDTIKKEKETEDGENQVRD